MQSRPRSKVPIIATVAAEWLDRLEKESGGKTKLFTDFSPKPGGQQKFWNVVPFGDAKKTIDINPGFRSMLLRGGRNSGKSFTGAVWLCTRAYRDPAAGFLISANDYTQLEKSTLPALAEVCEIFNIPLSPQGESPEETGRMIAARRLCKIFDAWVVVLSANKFGGTTTKSRQSARGGGYRTAWLDEWGFADRSSWTTFQASLGRGKGELDGFALITTTINTNDVHNWIWDDFCDPERSDDLREFNRELIVLTKDNADETYLRSLEATLTPELAAIELRGEFVVNTSGRAFPYFDRSKHVKSVEYNPRFPVLISVDFNRHPATTILAQQDGRTIKVFHEFYLLQSDTFKLGDAISSEVSSLSPAITKLYGDATGNIKTANSNQTNWAIIHNALKLKQVPFTRCYGASNPPVVDTLNSTNCLLHQVGRIEIDPSCKELIKDLEFVKLDNKGGLDKSDILRSQCSDGFRYLCHSLFPYRGYGGSNVFVGGKLENPFAKR